MEQAVLVLAGIAISSTAIAIGIGGGILWTPLLILAYGLEPLSAVATSLLIQVVGMGSGSLTYLRAGLVQTKLSVTLFILALPGVIIGSFLTVNLSPDTVQMGLGIMAMMLAILFVGGTEEREKADVVVLERKKLVKVAPIPAFFGVVMGSLSLGIGEWLIPALRHQYKLTMAQTIATVIPMMFLLALVASGMHLLLSDSIHMEIFVWGALGTLIGGQIGARISQSINERMLKQSFIYLMTLIGIHLIFQSI